MTTEERTIVERAVLHLALISRTLAIIQRESSLDGEVADAIALVGYFADDASAKLDVLSS